jgi:ribokinase
MMSMEEIKIVVIGSSNSDMVVQAEKLPLPGETVMGRKFFMNPGGKGANQAVAVARLGGAVAFICKIGSDLFGKQAAFTFKKEGINVDYIAIDSQNPSGVALIMVDAKGENSIMVAGGANNNLNETDIDKALPIIKEADILLMQLEIPLTTAEHVGRLAGTHKKRLILNPAPAQLLSDDLLKNVTIITPNETEAFIISGIKVMDETSALLAAQKIKSKGVENVVITMGSKGAFVLSDSFTGLVPTIAVDTIDTTAAGDVFSGALTVGICEGLTIKDAVLFANEAAAISVTKQGAQSSIPYRKDVLIVK